MAEKVQRSHHRPTEGVVRTTLLATELVDLKVNLVNDMWFGLKFTRRLKNRPKA